ncbi:MAG: cation:proton antiporter, partial [Xenococcaceae cyanobacterium MO_188.B19]|nr:cation:proton antiporter [Xenococcaceae cyanobacterium MO_188.B19]
MSISLDSKLSFDLVFSHPLLATEPNSETAPMVLAGVLLTLVFVYLASKLGGELSKLVDLPPVLGELVAGVLVGVSALHLLVFPETGAVASDSVVITILEKIAGLTPENMGEVFNTSSEVISILA